MTPKQYECITYYNLELKIAGFRDEQNRQNEVSRLIAFSSYIAPHLDPKKLRGITPQKFWQLVGDKIEKTVSFEDKKKAFMNLLDKVNGKVRN